MDPLRVILISSGAGIGGAERFVATLGAGLLARGHEVHVICPPGGWLGEHLRAGQVPAHPWSGTTPTRTLPIVASLLAPGRPTIVHSNLTRATYAALLCRMRLRLPVLATVHHVGSAAYRAPRPRGLGRLLGSLGISGKHTDWAFRRLVRSGGTLAAVSHFVRGCLLQDGLDPERVRVIHNGTLVADAPLPPPDPTVREELALGPGVSLLAMVGRVCPQKGQLLAIQALSLLKPPLRETVRLLLIGAVAESYRARLAGTIQALGLQDQVTLTGPRQDVHRLLCAADLAVHTSHAEACPLAVLEALALGKPVIGTRVGGIPEVIREGETGLLAGEDPGEVAAAMAALLGDDESRRQMGIAARTWAVERFTLSGMVESYERLYGELALASGR